ncbi:hypothetical protein [Duganella sp. Root336D2]|uniref:hypothetical protein n=1 Tax=Duganella sp. Root336D2 TaxID=1736518 RepID=UPI0012E3A5BE|nr:hypothetical protein [Duganella sp. Root336D2]
MASRFASLTASRRLNELEIAEQGLLHGFVLLTRFTHAHSYTRRLLKMNRSIPIIALSAISLFAISSSTAAELAGTWKFERARGFYSHQKNIAPPDQKTIQLVNNRTNFGPRCLGTYTRTKYSYHMLFQMAMKGGVDERELGSFTKKEFGVSLPAKGFYYRLEGPTDVCREQFEDVWVDGDRLLVAAGAEIFYSFVRTADPKVPFPELAGLTASHLPYDTDIFANHCAAQVGLAGELQRELDKCSPVFNSYIAKKESTNYIAQLVGNHDYRRGGASFADHYSTPFSHNQHPVFHVLPPLKGIVVVRVNDLGAKTKEDREVMGGVYLSIKSGKIVDQLNERCNLTEKYTCVDEDNNPQFQLLETGKFKRL